MKKVILNFFVILTAVLFGAAPFFLWNCPGDGTLDPGLKVRAATCCDTHQCCAHRTHKHCSGLKTAPTAVFAISKSAKQAMGHPLGVFLGFNPAPFLKVALVLKPNHPLFYPPGFSIALRI